jgi:hypothetical protein
MKNTHIAPQSTNSHAAVRTIEFRNIRFEEGAERLLFVAVRLEEYLGENFNDAAFSVILGDSDHATKLEVSHYADWRGSVEMRAAGDGAQVFIDSVINTLEGGANPAFVFFAEWTGAIEWVCDHVRRLSRLEAYWDPAEIAAALKTNDE